MTIHELTTNAAKYGALAAEGGRIDITWRIRTADGPAGGRDRRLALEWRESGGPPVAAPQRKGFGTRLISGGISRELGGTVDLSFPPEGVRCTLEVPLDEPDRFTSFRETSAGGTRALQA